ncbi:MULTISPECIES: hypothetical protein [unclassified Streptomyces]|uniref:hypothetical protein n=1 Tax=unclassified Streptomyces TaxID=2593676 RepID=UPI0023670885|nr:MULTISPECIES: hypothetical protein [unclassified Streptomyces]MDF3143991.1 hypothetical protein [Streptomyces sp. T21Q-yed]WDF37042.1 hypothetical protein PBV52_09740 [Streptomyces sp. T12]
MSDTVPETEIPQEEGAAEVAEAEVAAVAAAEPAGLAGEPTYDPAAPAPLNVPRTPTGNADVDAQLERLGDTDHLATDGHVEVYEDVHRGLRDALTALDARPGPPAPPSMPGMRS